MYTDTRFITPIGFRIDPEQDRPQLYSLMLGNESGDNFALVYEGQLAICLSPDKYDEALGLVGLDWQAMAGKVMPLLWIDFATAFYICESGGIDEQGRIVNVLNVVSDILIGLKIGVPAVFKSDLVSFADYVTFDRDVGAYFDLTPASKAKIIGGLQWCLGAIISRGRFL